MKRTQKIRIAVDVGLLVLLPVQMIFSQLSGTTHEWLGIMMAMLFIFHHALNRKWFKNLRKGKYGALRILEIVVDLLLLVDMLSLILSGIMMSQHVFAFLDIGSGIAFARTAHLMASYWGMLLMSFHAGLHGEILMGMLRKVTGIKGKSTVRTLVLRLIAALLIVLGIIAFFRQEIWTYLTLQSQFVFFDFSRPLVLVLADYALVMCLFAIPAYYITKLAVFSGKKHQV